jgi:hypothetical protein
VCIHFLHCHNLRRWGLVDHRQQLHPPLLELGTAEPSYTVTAGHVLLQHLSLQQPLVEGVVRQGVVGGLREQERGDEGRDMQDREPGQ